MENTRIEAKYNLNSPYSYYFLFALATRLGLSRTSRSNSAIKAGIWVGAAKRRFPYWSWPEGIYRLRRSKICELSVKIKCDIQKIAECIIYIATIMFQGYCSPHSQRTLKSFQAICFILSWCLLLWIKVLRKRHKKLCRVYKRLIADLLDSYIIYSA